MIADQPHTSPDALALIDVDYDELPVITTRSGALEPDAPLIRDEKEGQTDNVAYTLGDRRQGGHRCSLRRGRQGGALDTFYPRSHPAPLETLRVCRRRQPGHRAGHHLHDLQAPHAHRTLFAMVAGLPEQNIRIISPDIGGGFGNKVPIYPGYVVATAASLLLGKPVKWVEYRIGEHHLDRVRPRLPHERRAGARRDGHILAMRASTPLRPGRLLRRRPALQVPRRAVPHRDRQYDIPAAHVAPRACYTNKAPGGVAYRCSFRVTEASYLIERLVQNAAYELGDGPGEFRLRNFIQPDQFPYKSADRLRLRLGRLPGALDLALEMVGYEGCAEEAGGRTRRRHGCSGSASPRSPRWSAPAIQGLRHRRAARCSTRPSSASTRPARRSSSSASRARARATRRPSPRSSPRSSGSRRRTSRCRRATPTTRRTAWAPTPPAPPRSAGAATAVISRKLRDKAKQIAAHLLEAGRGGLELEHGAVLRQGLARPGCHHPGRRLRRLHQPP